MALDAFLADPGLNGLLGAHDPGFAWRAEKGSGYLRVTSGPYGLSGIRDQQPDA